MKTTTLLACALPVAGLLAAGAWLASPSAPATAPAKAPTAVRPAVKTETPAQETELALALEQKSIVAEFNGNGRDRLHVTVLSKATVPLRVTIPVGQIFESPVSGKVVVVRTGTLEIPPGKTRELPLATAALKASNKVIDSQFALSFQSVPKLESLLVKIQEDRTLSPACVQTAILALTENLPLSAFAKFVLASSVLPSRFNTDPFRADTQDLLAALLLLRELGVHERGLALTIDPQLKIESMIDPAARPLAMRYYGISTESEWEFWRRELLQGEPCTRHYALYGIARFYPDVALEMLPRWALETRTNPVYRLSAVQALADTQRPEAVALLETLQVELGLMTELGKAAKGAADYLAYQLEQTAAARSQVAFRTTQEGRALASAR